MRMLYHLSYRGRTNVALCEIVSFSEMKHTTKRIYLYKRRACRCMQVHFHNYCGRPTPVRMLSKYFCGFQATFSMPRFPISQIQVNMPGIVLLIWALSHNLKQEIHAFTCTRIHNHDKPHTWIGARITISFARRLSDMLARIY